MKPLSPQHIIFFVFTMTMLLTIPSQTVKLPDHPSHGPHDGGTLVWGTINPPTIINPVLTSHSVSSSLLGLLFDSLVRIDQHGSIVPDLAQSWSVSSDGLEYIFHLQAHVYFHDGPELTAEDVKFTYESIQDPSNQSYWRSELELVSHWDIIDRYTLRVTLKKTFPGFLLRLAPGILPKHLYEHTDLLTNPHNEAPVGTGPFRFVSWDKASHQIILQANQDYFEGRPFLDKIIVKSYEDNTALWGALMRQEVDFVKFLNYQDYKILSKDTVFKTYQVPAGLYFALVYDSHDPILFDRELRGALNYAIDRRALMEAAQINGVESNGPFYPASTWSNPTVERSSYNPVKARLMLAWRGWDKGPDGILRKGGQPLILTMLVDRNRLYYRQMARVLRQQFSEIGVALKIIFYDDENQLTPKYLEEVKPQIWLRMFVGNSCDPSIIVSNWYSTSSMFGHLWTYQNASIDQLFEKGRGLHDSKQRIDIYRQIHALIYGDQPACFLFFFESNYAVAAKVQNSQNLFNMYMPDYLIKDWYIN